MKNACFRLRLAGCNRGIKFVVKGIVGRRGGYFKGRTPGHRTFKLWLCTGVQPCSRAVHRRNRGMQAYSKTRDHESAEQAAHPSIIRPLAGDRTVQIPENYPSSLVL